MPPPQPVAATVNEYEAALAGVPASVSDFVSADVFITTPPGSDPDVICHLYGVHPPVTVITPKYESLRIPLGSAVVGMEMAMRPCVPMATSTRKRRLVFTSSCS